MKQVSSDQQNVSNKQATKFLIKLYLSKKGYIPVIVFVIGNLFAWNFPSLVIAKIINQVTNKSVIDAPSLSKYAFIVIGLMLFGEALARVGAHFQRRFVQKKVSELYITSFENIISKPMDFFNTTFSGGISNKIYRFVNGFESFARVIYFQVGIAISNTIFAFIVLGGSNPLAILTYVFICVMLIFSLKKVYKIRGQKSYEISKATSEVSAQMMDAFTNISVVKSLATQDFEIKNFKKSVNSLERKAVDFWDYSNIYLSIPLSVFIAINYGLALLFAIYSRSWGADPQVVYLTTTIFFHLTLQFWDFSRIYQDLQNNISSTAEGLELLNQDNVIKKTKPLVNFKSFGVDFKNINFSYKKSNVVFENFSLNIFDGQKVGLVGHSGVGKSTLTKLLLGYEQPVSGKILVGGKDISTVNDKELKSLIGYVPQDITLFHRSIYENITYGLQDVDKDIFERAVEGSFVDEFVQEFPDKYETIVGERGVKLSGGQRQRIAIARVLLQDFKILVLDEATSSLDSKSEHYIQQALAGLMENKTVLAIAHRLSTIAHLDRLVVIDSGKIVEQGSHQELILQNGLYKNLWDHQSGGYIN